MEHASGGAPRDQGALEASDPRIVAFLGPAYAAVLAFAEVLAREGVTRGLVGPREVPRLWERHLLNSAAVGALLPESGTLVDVGSGAGLPGVVLAAMRPGLRVVLLEPMERRVAWLEEVRALTGLGNLEVLRGRAEDVAGTIDADVVTARAVAPLDRLAGWTLPLLVRGGVLLAMKGQGAAQELEAAAGELERFGAGEGEVLTVSSIDGVDPTTVVRVVRQEVRGQIRPPAPAGGKKEHAVVAVPALVGLGGWGVAERGPAIGRAWRWCSAPGSRGVGA